MRAEYGPRRGKRGKTTNLTPPVTFREMFAPNKGDTRQQRVRKWYLKPRGKPETTIRVLESLQVDQFQKIPKAIAKIQQRRTGVPHPTQTLRDTRFSSLIDYATDKSGHNELMHLQHIIKRNIPFGALGVATDFKGFLAISAAATLADGYAILAQRYSRARLERIINGQLKRGASIRKGEYNNPLNLRLPLKSKKK